MDIVANRSRVMPTAFGFTVFVSLCLCGHSAMAGRYKVTTLDVPSATYTAITGINEIGTMAGVYVTSDGTTYGFAATPGVISTINGPSAVDTEVTGINNAGTAVGYYKSPGIVWQAFVWSDETLSPLNIGAYSRAFAINNKGHVAGNFGTKVSSNKQQGFLYRGGKFEKFKAFNSDYTQPLAINNSDEIVGIFWDPKQQAHSFLRKGTVITAFDPPGAPFGSYATGINDAGQIIGFYADKTRTIHGYLFSGGTFTTIDAPVTTNETKLTSINTAGQIAGYYNNDGSNIAFVYTGDQFAIIDTGAGTSATSNGFNDNQTVVGLLADGTGTHGFTATCPRAKRPCS